MVSHFDYEHRCLIEKNVPIMLILPSKWQDGAESLGIEHTSFLWLYLDNYMIEWVQNEQTTSV